MLQGMMKIKTNESQVGLFYKICLVITNCLGKLFTKERKLSWYDKVSKIGNNADTVYLGIYNDLFKYLNLKYTNCMLKECVDTAFESLLLPITTEFDNYLTTVYGDYMTPPNEKDRKSVHLN